MYLGNKQLRNKLEDNMKKLIEGDLPEELKTAFAKWIETKEDGEA